MMPHTAAECMMTVAMRSCCPDLFAPFASLHGRSEERTQCSCVPANRPGNSQ
jgi:hypothetical protein